MKILPPMSIGRQISSTARLVCKAGRDGYKIASRTSEIYHQNILQKTAGIGYGIGKQLAGKTTINDLPVIMGAVGMLLPIPFTSFSFFALGLIVKYGCKLIRICKQLSCCSQK